MKYDADFWNMLEKLVERSEIVIDRPKGTRHPQYANIIYPIDYGYLKDTASMDGSGIDVWMGTLPMHSIDAVMCTVDLIKCDSEIKILIGCAEKEIQAVYDFHNDSEYMKGILIRREVVK